ncbi:MAG: bifunctional phosphoribosylaminoimidazolecarboxamide formyltransferase/IMP cyclohydrolase, partial [Thermoanaerobaculia bacterium]|nr:bifunctional phosphoribosylaminoimidazolecarboxamide formyltransferase/IMP cyclohydrolase [Thermoanaerobaculia bacterium]
VKTLHPAIHAGLLADRGKAEQMEVLAQLGIAPIDLLVVNLYPFERTVAAGAGFSDCIEMIDVGGPAMLRAAAKNHAGVAVVSDPADYPELLAVLAEHGGEIPLPLRRRLAARAFAATAAYDHAVAAWFAREAAGEEPEAFPPRLDLALERLLAPRYGENPHQRAAVYRTRGGPGVLGGFEQLQGKELSWNNLLDADAARRLIALFAEPAVAIVKHNNPCGVGRGDSLRAAYDRALACDPVSAFGSIVACNRELDEATAAAVAELFVEVVIAPGATPEARERLAARRNLRLLLAPPYRPLPGEPELRGIDGGFLAQTPDAGDDDPAVWEVPTRRAPTAGEREALAFAWRVVRHVRSNAIVVANEAQTVGIGAGQMSRVDSCRLAVQKAVLPVAGAVAASDAFFPFRDGLDLLAEAGVTAVIQPGGSVRDAEVIAAADERGLALVHTGRRHFRH